MKKFPHAHCKFCGGEVPMYGHETSEPRCYQCLKKIVRRYEALETIQTNKRTEIKTTLLKG